ncbi:hypothetical protein Ahy_A07g035480 [Arachis hypogaea]|uniref:Uncharacterized protein n=1 Tax=Arachis hypogaea TaxID=3818 RepID=A0A445CDZ4_ARAHY|nr:hypothetical protein Ahy_A07g035480 [Arachis hypogaea]
MNRLQAIICQKEQEEAQRMNEAIEANLAKIKANLDVWDSYRRQSISIEECGESTEERSMECVMQQVERMEIVDEEEVVESLGKVEQEVDSKFENTSTPSDVVDDLVEIVEPFSNELEFGVEEDNAQLPRHSMNDERLEEDDQEASSTNEECVEEVGGQGIEVEKACQEVEVVKEEHKGVKLARSLGPSLPKSLSNTTFKWVKFLSLSFTFSLEYGLLKTDGQLRALCGIKSKRELVNGWNCQSRFFMVGNSKSKYNGRYSSQLYGSRRIIWCPSENSMCLPPKWTCLDKLEYGCRNKIWDSGIYEDQFWESLACVELHQSLVPLILRF